MSDKISFIFSGKLTEKHQMDFYEASRFQYAAARLTVKLDRFRRTGRFPKKVTSLSNTEVNLQAYRDGSFAIDILTPLVATLGPLVLEVPITALWSYVIERVFKPADSEAIQQALASQAELIAAFREHIAASETQARDTLNLLSQQIERNQILSDDNRQLQQRLLGEVERRAYLEGQQSLLRQITAEQDAQLVTMAAPLLKELAVPLRRSASSATIAISDRHGSRPILTANKAMADEIELTVVDPTITTLLINIIQYNKENGWGKFRNLEFDGLASFSVPADRKDRLQPRMLAAMNEDEAYVQAYYVKSITGEKLRIIIVDFSNIEKAEAGQGQQD